MTKARPSVLLPERVSGKGREAGVGGGTGDGCSVAFALVVGPAYRPVSLIKSVSVSADLVWVPMGGEAMPVLL